MGNKNNLFTLILTILLIVAISLGMYSNNLTSPLESKKLIGTLENISTFSTASKTTSQHYIKFKLAEYKNVFYLNMPYSEKVDFNLIRSIKVNSNIVEINLGNESFSKLNKTNDNISAIYSLKIDENVYLSLKDALEADKTNNLSGYLLLLFFFISIPYIVLTKNIV